MTDPHMIALEEQVAHQQTVIDDLSDMVRRQGLQIERLERRVAMLIERSATAEAEGGSHVFTDPPPPHY